MDKIKILFNSSIEDLEAEVNEFLKQNFIINVKSVEVLSTNNARYCGYVCYVHYVVTNAELPDY